VRRPPAISKRAAQRDQIAGRGAAQTNLHPVATAPLQLDGALDAASAAMGSATSSMNPAAPDPQIGLSRDRLDSLLERVVTAMELSGYAGDAMFARGRLHATRVPLECGCVVDAPRANAQAGVSRRPGRSEGRARCGPLSGSAERPCRKIIIFTENRAQESRFLSRRSRFSAFAVDFVAWLLDFTLHPRYIALRWGVAPGHCSGPRPSARFLGIRSGNAYSGGGETIAVEVEDFSGDGSAPVCIMPDSQAEVARTGDHCDSVCFLDSSLTVVTDKGEVIA